MRNKLYTFTAAIILITVSAVSVVRLIGDKPSNRPETPYILEYIKTSKVVTNITGEIFDLQLDPADWRISNTPNGIQAMYGIYVSGNRANIKFRIYWECKESASRPQVYRITIVGEKASRDQEVWTMEAQ